MRCSGTRPARRACRRPAATGRASACSGGSGPGRGASGPAGSRRPRCRQVLVRDPDVVVDDLGVAAEVSEVLDRVLHGRHVADDVDARRVGGDDDHRAALVRVDVGVGHGHDDEEVGDRAVGREPLVAVDDPLVAVAHRRGLEQRRVGARHPGSVIENALRSSPSSSGCSQLALLPPCRDCPMPTAMSSALPESGALLPKTIGRVRRTGRGSRASGPSLTWPNPPPPSSGGEVRGPQALVLHLLLQRLDDSFDLVVRADRASRAE